MPANKPEDARVSTNRKSNGSRAPKLDSRGATVLRPSTKVAGDVRSALDHDSRIPHAAQIAVSADEIGTVTLRGTVGSPQQKHAAREDAATVAGVFEVLDQLEIRLSESRHRHDDTLRGRALQALMSDASIPAERIQVMVQGGWVTLKGEVTHRSQRSQAFEEVSRLPEVTGVKNEIRVVADPRGSIVGEGDEEEAAPAPAFSQVADDAIREMECASRELERSLRKTEHRISEEWRREHFGHEPERPPEWDDGRADPPA